MEDILTLQDQYLKTKTKQDENKLASAYLNLAKKIVRNDDTIDIGMVVTRVMSIYPQGKYRNPSAIVKNNINQLRINNQIHQQTESRYMRDVAIVKVKEDKRSCTLYDLIESTPRYPLVLMVLCRCRLYDSAIRKIAKVESKKYCYSHAVLLHTIYKTFHHGE